MQNTRPTKSVILYRDQLLPASETFIRAQGEALRTFTPYYVGMRPQAGLALPSDRTYLLNPGGPMGYVREYLLKLGAVPSALSNQVRKISPSLIHAHFGRDASHILPLIRAKKLPFFVTFHGWDATASNETVGELASGRRFLRRRRELGNAATTIIAVSQFIADCLVERGFPREKIVVHYIGVDTEEFAPRANLEREDVVLFVARLVEKKGCEFLLRAMAEVQRQTPNARLVVIGDGPLRSELEAFASGSLRDCIFLGAQPTPVVREWMSRARVFCVPSIVARSGDAEGFGIVFIEAQAVGTPVVSFSSGGVCEAVAHGSTGFLAPERDWRELARHIIELFRNPPLWKQFSTAAIERVRTSFSLQHQCRALEEMYVSAIQSH